MHRLLLATTLAVGAAFAVPVLGQALDLTFETRDLRLETTDLAFPVEDVAGPVENLQVTETETEIRIHLSGDVLFDFDKADIRAEAEPVLREVADVLKEHPDAAVRIAGYTDAEGSESYNLELSQRRAASVKTWLVMNGGVTGPQLTTAGYGETNPVASNTNPDGSDNPEGRQKNRRVEIAVQK